MKKIVGIRFKDAGKVYYFEPGAGEVYTVGEKVIVETIRGIECGEVSIPLKEIDEDKLAHPLKKILRKASAQDLRTLELNKTREAEAFAVCEKKIQRHGLDMKLVDVEYSLDGSKILFYFTADSRVDFRELVKDLAGTFRTRIELRQIGVRDEAKMLGGLGVCGRPFCCNTFMGDFQPVSIKMAKEQSLSLNPVKISGTCGRLMCCLKYEQPAYEHLLRVTPKIGALVETKEGVGTVIDSNLLTGKLKVKLNNQEMITPVTVDRHDVKIIKDGQIKVEKSEIDAFKDIE